MSKYWRNLNILNFGHFNTIAKQFTSQISHMLDHIVIKQWSTNLTFETNTQRPSKCFCVVSDSRMWIMVWNKSFLKLIAMLLISWKTTFQVFCKVKKNLMTADTLAKVKKNKKFSLWTLCNIAPFNVQECNFWTTCSLLGQLNASG